MAKFHLENDSNENIEVSFFESKQHLGTHFVQFWIMNRRQ